MAIADVDMALWDLKAWILDLTKKRTALFCHVLQRSGTMLTFGFILLCIAGILAVLGFGLMSSP